MREISTLDIAALVNELNLLAGWHIDKFYELRDGQFRIRLSKSGEKINLNCILSHTLNRSIYIETPEEPTNFSLAVRSKTDGLALNGVSQLNYDRIIDISAGTADRETHIILEMFGKGNLVIANSGMKILLAYRTHDYRDRSVRAGAVYEPPKSNQTKMGDLVKAESAEKAIRGILAPSTGSQNAVSSIAKALNFGGVYVEEAFNEAGVSLRSSVGELDDIMIAGIAKRISEMLGYTMKPSPTVFLESGKALDYAICDLKKYGGLEKMSFGSVSEALDFFYNENRVDAAPKKNEAIEQLKASIKKQEDLIVQVAEEISAAKASGESIFNNLTAINAIITAARQNKRITAEEMQTLFPNVKITNIDLKEKSITIDI